MRRVTYQPGEEADLYSRSEPPSHERMMYLIPLTLQRQRTCNTYRHHRAGGSSGYNYPSSHRCVWGLNYCFGELLEQRFRFVSDKKCDIVLQNEKEPYQGCASPSVCSALHAADSASGKVGCGCILGGRDAALQQRWVPTLLC